MYERLKTIRSEVKLNQSDFAKALGIGQSTLAMMEVGKREILDRHIKTICSIFKVNEEWLRTGNGEMFNQTKTTIIEKLSAQYNLSYYGQKMIETYLNLDKGQQEAIDGFFKAFAESCNTASDISDVNVDDTIKLYHAAKSERNTESE